MHRIGRFAAIFGLITCTLIAFEGVIRAQASNTWTSVGHMTQVRNGAAAVLLSDGRILISGGTDTNGVPQTSTEMYDPNTGTFSATSAMKVARANHAAIVLITGDVLVTGGLSGPGGGYNDSAELYNVAGREWTLLQASLGTGLAGHAMANLSDGNVLIAGGASTVGPITSLLLFKLSDGSMSPVGTMITARTDAAAAETPDGRVLIAGGTDINGAVLASTEIFLYNPTTTSGTISAGPLMTSARTNATATATYDGVAVIGGSDGSSDLRTAEIFSQWTNTFRVVAGGNPTSHHFAAMLPHNGAILTMGGTAGSAVNLLQPWANNIAGAFIAVASSLGNHAGGIAAPGNLGSLLAAGGQSDSGANAELYWFPTISTDQSDYPPGTPVVMTGTGFQPGEAVDLHMHIWSNQTVVDPPDYTASSDAAGTFMFNGYAPDTTDLGARYHLTAIGKASGLQAQTVFTDGGTPTVGCNPASVAVNSQTTCTATISGQSGRGDTIVWTASGTGSFTPSTCAISASNPGTCSVKYTPSSAPAGGQTITATDVNKSGSFNLGVYGSAAKLAFSQQPTTTTAGNAISPAVTVMVEDGNGNVVMTDSSNVTIGISTGGTFSSGSALIVAASSGVATFSNLVPTTPGSFTLSAQDKSLRGTSASFTVNAA